MTLKLSTTSKLGTKSWSLQAGAPVDGGTCIGSIDADGNYVDACSGCYARGGFYRFGAAKAVRKDNHSDWKRDSWVSEMVMALAKQKHFRWFDSGDLYSTELAEKIYTIMVATPNTKHWLPTRMAKFPKFQAIIAKMQALPNVMVRFSSDSVNGEFTRGVHGSTIVPSADTAPSDTFVCGAYSRDGKCGDCRACYDKDIPVIAYPAHGATMKKVIRLRSV